MSKYTSSVMQVEAKYNNKVDLLKKVADMENQLRKGTEHYLVMLEAQRLLATVSDDNTTAVLDYMTGIINRTLKEMFPYDTRRIFLEKKLHAGQHAHLVVKLTNSYGVERDLTLQSGTGLRQVISFLFVVSLIEITKGRRILLMDELLSGLHAQAKAVIAPIMKIFADEGFQFIVVEYGLDIGKKYLVEKPSATSTVTPFSGDYNNEVFIFNRPAEEVDKSIKEESDDE